MLIQIYTTNHPHSTGKPFHLTPFEARELNSLAERNNLGFCWQGDPERFRLIAQETVKVGTPVNRNDADYWISQFARLGAIGEGERVGRVKTVEVTK